VVCRCARKCRPCLTCVLCHRPLCMCCVCAVPLRPAIPTFNPRCLISIYVQSKMPHQRLRSIQDASSAVPLSPVYVLCMCCALKACNSHVQSKMPHQHMWISRKCAQARLKMCSYVHCENTVDYATSTYVEFEKVCSGSVKNVQLRTQ